ncbi:MAG: tyrosine-type recombinase/integrase [Rhizobiales bacterium]|nr:tyrosine-type recombinase/integrase [Hyphomicrobiales bacterium]
MSRHRHRAVVNLPRAVHRVVSRGREYFYYQAGRGTDHASPRIPLPNDPHSPEFWNAIRQAQGIVGPIPTDTINALADAHEIAWPTLPRKLSDATKEQYRRSLRVVRTAWGDLRADALRPSHVQALIDGLANTPGKANNVLDALRAMCRWAMGPRELLSRDPTLGVAHFADGEGHKPWTPEQLKFADENFTGMLRRAYVLARYTGQRISDVVRLGFTDIDEGGFALRQKKTGVRPWCPIFPELESEMATWEKRPGPFLVQDNGKPFSTNQLWKVFNKAREDHAELKDAVWHGLRANAVIRLRQSGYSTAQISDMIGMSPPMVERYSRHADRKAGGQAVLLALKQGQTANGIVKR